MPGLIHLREINPSVVILQDAVVTPTKLRQAVGADLAHTDAVAPASSGEDKRVDPTVGIVAAIDHEKLLPQSQRRANASAANVGRAFSADDRQIDCATGRAPRDDLQIHDKADAADGSRQT